MKSFVGSCLRWLGRRHYFPSCGHVGRHIGQEGAAREERLPDNRRACTGFSEALLICAIMLPQYSKAATHVLWKESAAKNNFATELRSVQRRLQEYVFVLDPSPHVGFYITQSCRDDNFWTNPHGFSGRGMLWANQNLSGPLVFVYYDIRKFEMLREQIGKGCNVLPADCVSSRRVPSILPSRRNVITGPTVITNSEFQVDSLHMHVSSISSISLDQSSSHQESLVYINRYRQSACNTCYGDPNVRTGLLSYLWCVCLVCSSFFAGLYGLIAWFDLKKRFVGSILIGLSVMFYVAGFMVTYMSIIAP